MKQKILGLLFLLCFVPALFAVVIFEDNFNDGNTNGWTAYGYNTGNWQTSSSTLKFNGTNYTNYINVFTMDGLITPQSFTMEADVRVSPTDNSTSHIGFIWGFQNTSNFNTAYLRTHSDHVTHWSYIGGSQSSESYVQVPGADNNVWYHMKITVDYTTKTMTTNFGGYTNTFTGTAFDTINRNSGGKMGVVTWGEVGYFDNVVITNNVVPEASTLLSVALAILVCFSLKIKNL